MLNPLTTLATVFAILVYFALGMVAGRARSTYGVTAPAMTGHIEFEKRSRVQINTLEQIVIFLPLLWLSLGALGDLWAALVGLVWSAGRIIYARAYYADPAKRSLGFTLTMLPTIVLLVATIWGAVRGLMI
ncbi:MAPEG family protein [Polymorphobacter arshaanensis]|uniref:MAPEG family protein n=2 Tax=Glacieibacterium arshaanense TaxID=2511025 RepID=A0A4Y9ESM8_9SPHN|nr:MAPEG family protein [Polymorphobacter arshaanensis]